MAGTSLRVHAVALTPGSTDATLPALRRALTGDGPALALVDAAPGGPPASVVDMLAPDAPVDRDDVAVVVATSGSTGAPKGVLLTGAALRASAAAAHDRLGGSGRWLLALSPARAGGLQVLVRSLLAETAPVTMPGPFTAEAFAAATASMGSGPRYTALVPTQLRRVLDAGGAAVDALASFDAIVLGGAAAPAALRRRADAAGVRVVPSYGMTETCGGCVYAGRPLEGVSVRLAQDGRIAVGGATVFAGYRLRPDLTAAALVDGWHLTQDRGRLDADGRLEVLGRLDDVAVSGGVNVPLAAVEEALADLPELADVAVVGVSDEIWGERVVAYVVPRPGRPAPSLAAVRDHVGATLPRTYAPREVVVVDALPTLPSGKVDRLTLRAGPL